MNDVGRYGSNDWHGRYLVIGRGLPKTHYGCKLRCVISWRGAVYNDLLHLSKTRTTIFIGIP